MEKIPFTTEEERASVIAQQESLGHYLIEEQNLSEGNFLIFEDAPIRTRYQAALKSDVLIQHLANASGGEIDDWVDGNVKNLADAKALFKKMLAVMSYLLNREGSGA